MYCPRCGRQPVSNELRFCSYCGFKLGIVKASLADDDESIPTTPLIAPSVAATPRHRNTNIGVILMFLGAMLATFLTGPYFGLHRVGAGVILTLSYAVILMLSGPIMKGVYRLFSWGEPSKEHLSTIQREMGFGATLGLLSTILSALISLLTTGRMNTTIFAVSLLITFVVWLGIAPYLMRALRYLLRDERTAIPSMISEHHQHALPPQQEIPISMLGASRTTTAEIVAPPASVTEQTTGLLK